MSEEETRFKIRRRTDGLFSTGGSYPRFTSKGKIWSKIGYLRRHLSMFATKLLRQYYNDCEIVEFKVEVSEVGTQIISDEIRRISEERQKKQERRAEQSRKLKESTEKAQLANLLNKYGDPR